MTSQKVANKPVAPNVNNNIIYSKILTTPNLYFNITIEIFFWEKFCEVGNNLIYVVLNQTVEN